jgi:hypothetical protein
MNFDCENFLSGCCLETEVSKQLCFVKKYLKLSIYRRRRRPYSDYAGCLTWRNDACAGIFTIQYGG